MLTRETDLNIAPTPTPDRGTSLNRMGSIPIEWLCDPDIGAVPTADPPPETPAHNSSG
jgi:hypothetical protein